ncbi:MAG: DUF1365 domain-containing protein [Dehalococcoidia bacterium]
MRSKLYAGTVRHQRTTPRAYRFTYGVYYFCLDLDEIEEVARRIRPFSYNRLNLLSFMDGDHMGAPGQGVRAAARERLAACGIDLDNDGGNVTLLTYPRLLNHVFNPISIYFYRDGAGQLRHVLAEVHNTYGERHTYDMDRTGGDGCTYESKADKVFYVSPFIGMDARYEFVCHEREGALDVRIDEFRGEELFFQAQLLVSPLPLTNANVAKMLLRYPLVTLKTIALIHWYGLRLWLGGVKYLPNPRKAKAGR